MLFFDAREAIRKTPTPTDSGKRVPARVQRIAKEFLLHEQQTIKLQKRAKKLGWYITGSGNIEPMRDTVSKVKVVFEAHQAARYANLKTIEITTRLNLIGMAPMPAKDYLLKLQKQLADI